MRVIPKFPNNHSYSFNYSFDHFYEKVEQNKQIGLLGKQCHFIVETKATFDSDVINFI